MSSSFRMIFRNGTRIVLSDDALVVGQFESAGLNRQFPSCRSLARKLRFGCFRSSIILRRRTRLSRNITQENCAEQIMIPIKKGASASANSPATYGKLGAFSVKTPANILVAFQDRTSAARRSVRWEKFLIDRILEWQSSHMLWETDSRGASRSCTLRCFLRVQRMRIAWTTVISSTQSR